MKKLHLILLLLPFSLFTSCASHQFENKLNEKHENGASWRIEEDVLIVQLQRYQFTPNSGVLMLEVRQKAKQIAKERGLKIGSINVTTERNITLGVTSAIAMCEVEQ
tara:strand:- start:597 stop:917 length:321 start_codon:yes stop_codon:yes gene_type:complete